MSDFAPGVTPPPNQPLPPLNCPRPTQKYCYWEPDVAKDEYYTCWRSGILYTSSSNSLRWGWNGPWITHTIASTTDYSYSTTWDPKISFSTLCDGYPRAPPGATPTIVTFTKVRPCTTNSITRCVSLEAASTTSDVPWPTSPTCKIPEKECASLSHAYASMMTSFFGGWYSSQIPMGLWQSPPCTADYTKYYPQATCEPPSPSRVECDIVPGSVTMLYWPTKASSADLCTGRNGTSATVTDTAPGPERTAVYDGTTLTSPTAYMILNTLRNIQTVSVSGHRESTWCGPSPPPVTLPIPPQSASKIYWLHGTEYRVAPFDFKDVNTISYAAYSDEVCRWGAMRQQVNDDCKTLWGGYSPTMVVPPQVTEAVKNWEGCGIWQMAQVEKWVPLDGAEAEKRHT